MMTNTCENSVAPHESARNETPVCISGQVQIQEWKSTLQKLRDERVNSLYIYIYILSGE